MDIASKLKAVNPEQNFSNRDLLEQMMREQRALSEESRPDFSAQTGVNTPRYWGDFSEGVANAPQADYSAYIPRERFDIAEALKLARAVGQENRELALSAMTPRSIPMKKGFNAFMEGALPLISGGFSNATQKRSIYEKEAEKTWVDEQERKRKLKDAEFRFALEQYKIDRKTQIEQEKMAQKERMHRENMMIRQMASQKEYIDPLEKAIHEAEIKKITKDYTTEPGWIDTLKSYVTGETPQSRAKAIVEMNRNGGRETSKKKESLIDRRRLIDQANDQRQRYEEGGLPFQQRDSLDVPINIAKGYGKSVGKGLASAVDTASWLGHKLPYVGEYIPETKLAENDAFKLTPDEKSLPIQRLGNEIGEDTGLIPLASLLVPGGAAIRGTTKLLGGAGKIGKTISEAGKFWKAGNRLPYALGAVGAGAGRHIVDESTPDSDPNKGLKKLGAEVAGSLGLSSLPKIVTKKLAANMRKDALDMFKARDSIGLPTSFGDITNNDLVLNYLANAPKTFTTSNASKAKFTRDFNKLNKGFPELKINSEDVARSDLGDLAAIGIDAHEKKIMGPIRESYKRLSEDVLTKANKEYISSQIKDINKRITPKSNEFDFEKLEKNVKDVREKGIPLSRKSLNEKIENLKKHPSNNKKAIELLTDHYDNNEGLLESIKYVKEYGRKGFQRDSQDADAYKTAWRCLKESVNDTIHYHFGNKKGTQITKNLAKMNESFSSEKRAMARFKSLEKKKHVTEGEDQRVSLANLLIKNTKNEGGSILDLIHRSSPESIDRTNNLLNYFLAKGTGEISPQKIKTASSNIKSKRTKELLTKHLTDEEKLIRDNSDIIYDQLYKTLSKGYPNTGSLTNMYNDLRSAIPTFDTRDYGKIVKNTSALAFRRALLALANKPLTKKKIESLARGEKRISSVLVKKENEKNMDE